MVILVWSSLPGAPFLSLKMKEHFYSTHETINKDLTHGKININLYNYEDKNFEENFSLNSTESPFLTFNTNMD